MSDAESYIERSIKKDMEGKVLHSKLTKLRCNFPIKREKKNPLSGAASLCWISIGIQKVLVDVEFKKKLVGKGE